MGEREQQDPTRVDYADSELRYNAFMAPAYRTALAALDLPRDRPSTGLDVGCGPGGLFALLDEATAGRATILGLDVSEPHLAAARGEIARHGLDDRVAVRQADLRERLPLPDAAVDWALAADVLWPSLFARPPAVVAEVARVVRPGGTVAVWFYSSRGVILPGHPDVDHYLDLATEQGWFGARTGNAHHEQAAGWLRAAGLTGIDISWHTVSGRAPLTRVGADYLGGYWLPERRALAREQLAAVGMGDEAWQRWRELSDPDAPGYALGQEAYHFLQFGMLVRGSVPCELAG
jgi:ubiquinone/menaquinone biosynthesis C-methylase UbiE